MNRKEYNGDPRYAKVLEKMDLLGIMDVTTTRQDKNGTITWRLPIKNKWNKASFIEVGSFSTGYVRNNNSCYTNYQLNKRRESEPQYYPVYEWCDKRDMNVKTDKFRQYTTRTCKLIPIEIERLEYLISYCLKNYYIKHANFVADGEFVPKWRYDNLADAARLDYEKLDSFHESYADFNDSMLEGMVPKWKYDNAVSSSSNDFNGHRARINDLEDKLDKAEKNEFYPHSMEIRVNGQIYKVV